MAIHSHTYRARKSKRERKIEIRIISSLLLFCCACDYYTWYTVSLHSAQLNSDFDFYVFFSSIPLCLCFFYSALFPQWAVTLTLYICTVMIRRKKNNCFLHALFCCHSFSISVKIPWSVISFGCFWIWWMAFMKMSTNFFQYLVIKNLCLLVFYNFFLNFQ